MVNTCMQNNIVHNFICKTIVFVLLLGAAVSVSNAAQIGDNSLVNFTGVLKRRPCHISNDKIINIHFGDVGVKKVDGKNYSRAIPYSIECEEVGQDLSLKLYLKADHPWFNYTTITTSNSNLGLNIYQNGKLMEINEGLKIDYNSPPDLIAIPIKRSNSDLKEGPFTATATLLAEYD